MSAVGSRDWGTEGKPKSLLDLKNQEQVSRWRQKKLRWLTRDFIGWKRDTVHAIKLSTIGWWALGLAAFCYIAGHVTWWLQRSGVL